MKRTHITIPRPCTCEEYPFCEHAQHNEPKENLVHQDNHTHIMNVEVSRMSGAVPQQDKFRVKFVAFVGETGPELIMPRLMAQELFNELDIALNQE